ncbi:hypothetical protein [Halarcobacter ebronensis]|uniref:Uncharacterized protein n=1 Tax=Halarcobacter ebronensis TaxID=1462615 RepID=A0A4Q1AL69_9BACT|nr:hypothetical protein [Halarcobacter ebronensis]QKF81606.1 hypothetical protein AEBR_1110 [Halarcobacter ebronensis]RXK05534.1 hypothetical protein CRV07_08460 [Halarcobacter ebronensis]
MQYFGVIETKYEEIFVTSSFLYFNKEDETISAKELKDMIKTTKDRKKNIVGTIFLYNPVVTPMGYDSNKFLLDQEFDDFGDYIELKQENYITTFKQAMKNSYEGKLVEIKNLFNLNEEHIDSAQLLTKFNSDLETYNSSQNTEFEREIMYFDAQTFIPSGKFVFFAWGEKINSKEFPYIDSYARTIYERVVQMGKKVAFVYKKEKTKEWCEQYLQFAAIGQNAKYKASISSAVKASFEHNPPIIVSYE